jgi:ATP/ADP translocase
VLPSHHPREEKFLSLVGQIRPEERRQTYAASALIGGIIASHSLLETARDALFLARLPPAQLAWVYLAIAVVSLALFVLQEYSPARSGRTALCAWLIVAAAIDVLLWSIVARSGTWALYVFYTWTGVFASLVVVRFWTLLGDLFSISLAKRVFSLIGAGGVGGAILGSLLARILTGRSGFPAPSGSFTPPLCGLVLQYRSHLVRSRENEQCGPDVRVYPPPAKKRR